MKILILGGGNAAERYVESLFFNSNIEIIIVSFGIANKSQKLANKYYLRIIAFDSLNTDLLQHVDCILLCIPLSVKLYYTQRLLDMGYNGALVFEKPLALTVHEVEEYQTILTNFEKYYVAYNRDFWNYSVPWVVDGRCVIKWATVFSGIEDNIIHNLPHILNWMLKCNYSDISLSIFSEDTVVGSLDGNPLSIRFIKSKEPTHVINCVELPRLDYIHLNQMMINNIFQFDQTASQNSLKRSYQIAKIISNIRR